MRNQNSIFNKRTALEHTSHSLTSLILTNLAVGFQPLDQWFFTKLMPFQREKTNGVVLSYDVTRNQNQYSHQFSKLIETIRLFFVKFLKPRPKKSNRNATRKINGRSLKNSQ